MNIFLIEPFFSGSHQQWATGLQKHSRNKIKIFSLPGRHWKWRMYGGAVSLAKQLHSCKLKPELILASDMLDLPTFMALCRQKIGDIPIAIYFHENQINYPWSPEDPDPKMGRNNQYGFINYTSALVANAVYFNSDYHKRSFLEGLPDFLGQFPDKKELENVSVIRKKSEVLPLGMELQSITLDASLKKDVPVILWNHRWEYDKDPDLFFQTLYQLKREALDFRLIVSGESYRNKPAVFDEAKKYLEKEILHFGYAASREEYLRLLQIADILPVTGRQDFFGGSVVEAIYANCYPLLPDRLAYPEHIPPQKRKEHLYKDPEELLEKLKNLLQNQRLFINQNFQNFVAHYDWSILASAYDQKFEELVGGKVEKSDKTT